MKRSNCSNVLRLFWFCVSRQGWAIRKSPVGDFYSIIHSKFFGNSMVVRCVFHEHVHSFIVSTVFQIGQIYELTGFILMRMCRLSWHEAPWCVFSVDSRALALETVVWKGKSTRPGTRRACVCPHSASHWLWESAPAASPPQPLASPSKRWCPRKVCRVLSHLMVQDAGTYSSSECAWLRTPQTSGALSFTIHSYLPTNEYVFTDTPRIVSSMEVWMLWGRHKTIPRFKYKLSHLPRHF